MKDYASGAPRQKFYIFGDSSKRGCGATVVLESGEPCLLSIAQSVILVKRSKHGIFGATLYNEKNVYINARRTGALAYLFPDKQVPDSISNLSLRAFFNAILHCHNANDVCTTLNEAIQLAESRTYIRPIFCIRFSIMGVFLMCGFAAQKKGASCH